MSLPQMTEGFIVHNILIDMAFLPFHEFLRESGLIHHDLILSLIQAKRTMARIKC